jgi:hypothetical protein
VIGGLGRRIAALSAPPVSLVAVWPVSSMPPRGVPLAGPAL